MKEKSDQRERNRSERYGQRQHDNNLDLLTYFRYLYIPPEDVFNHFKERREKREAEERKELEFTVNSWREELSSDI